MKHDEKMILVTPACCKIYHIHDAICLLKQVERTLILLTLYKLVRWVVQLCHYNRDFILANSELFVVMSIKCVVLVVALSSLTICCFSFQVSSSALARLFGTTTISRSRRILIITVLIVTIW